MRKNYQLILDKTLEEIKGTKPKLLLHSCCAPCSSYVLKYLSNYFEITIYYYNPNIDTKEEFDLRAEEQIRLIGEIKGEHKIDYVIEYFEPSEFEEIAKGREEDKEGGERCGLCYNLRLEKTAIYAKEHGYDYFTTTLSISPYKNSQKLNEIGEKLGEKYNINYLYADFKKNNGYKQSIELSKQYNLYRQDYCGCKYSKIEHERRLQRKRALEIVIPKEPGKEKENLDDTLVASLTKDDLKEELASLGNYKDQEIKHPRKTKIVLFIIALALLITPSYCMLEKKINIKNYVKYEDIKASVTEIYTYGNHMHLDGNLNVGPEYNFDKVTLYLLNGKEEYELDPIYDFKNGIISFKFNNKINEGIVLDEFNEGNYELFLKEIYDYIKEVYNGKNC